MHIQRLVLFVVCFYVYVSAELSPSFINDSLFRHQLRVDIAATPLLPEEYRKVSRRSLPVRVDNSASKHFRPVFTQSGGSCTMASTIGYTFTYLYNAAHDLDGSLEENQFPTHFIWNFCNGGGYTSVGKAVYLLRKMGTVTIPTWGEGIGSNEDVWKSGYDLYVEAMKRKASVRYLYPIESIEDIEVTKSWLHSMNGLAEYGGLLGFSNNFINYSEAKMTSGSQAGKSIVTSWGKSGGHFMTIVGYDDSACFDFNGDGKYTNDIDINEDGKVTLADREWGCFKVVNSWGTGKHDKGFFYFPYRHYALPADSGGLSGSDDRFASVLMPVKANQKVLGTFEVKMSTTKRRAIKIHRGIARGDAEKPLQVNEIDLGEDATAVPFTGTDSTIVMGFDASELLSHDSYLEEDTLSLFFGVSSDSATGTIHEVTYHDYRTGTDVIYKAKSLPVTFDSNTVYLKIPVVRSGLAEEVTITSDTIKAKIGSTASHRVTIEGGVGPFSVKLDSLLYDIGIPLGEKPTVFDQCYNNYWLSYFAPKDWGGIAIELPFNVQYFGKEYDSVTASAYGKLYFRDPLMTSAGGAYSYYPKVKEDLHYYPALNLSGPAVCVVDTSKNKNDPKIEGFYYQINDNSIDFRYGGIYFGAPMGIGYEQFTTRIHKNGRIDTYIDGTFSITDSSLDKEIVMGISDGYGNAQSYPIYTCREFRDIVSGDGLAYSYIPSSMPEVCTLTPEGKLTLKSNKAGHWRVPIAVTDSRGVTVKKCIQFIVGETGVVEEVGSLDKMALSVVSRKLHLNGFKQGKAKLSVYSLLGRKLYDKTLILTDGHASLNLPRNIHQGVVLVEVSQGSRSFVRKVVLD